MFKTDQPIKRKEDDVLGRYPFAKALGDAIVSYKNKDNLVIGVYGEWGSGKTSILNMTIEYIMDIPSDCKKEYILMKFNPWHYSDSKQLISLFFRQLSVELRKPNYSKEIEAVGKLLVKYAKMIASLSATKLPPIVIIHLLLLIFELILKKIGSKDTNDLTAIKLKLDKLLEKLDHKIIVVIDDLDRLNDDEIRQMFQLVKCLGDFPNIIYLLAFDRDIVIKSLDTVQDKSGEKYLEKIIQIPFDVPMVSKDEVLTVMKESLIEVIKDLPEDKWNKGYWSDIYQDGLRYFFNNIRDVNRFINTFRFSYGMLRSEVNVIDLIAMTAIQVFIPELYLKVKQNKEVFTGSFEDPVIHIVKPKEYLNNRFNELLISTAEPYPDFIKDFLIKIFPIHEENVNNRGLSNTWRKECRVCSPEHFDVYFRLSIQQDELSQSELESVLDLGCDPNLFKDALIKLSEEGKAIKFLERLEGYTKRDIPQENIESIVSALMDIGDKLPEGGDDIFEISTHLRISRIIYQLSIRLNEENERYTVLKNAISKSSQSLHTIVYIIRCLGEEHGKYVSEEGQVPPQTKIVSFEHLIVLEKLACEHIEKWATENRLHKAKKFSFILYMWKVWSERETVDKYVKDLLNADEGLVNFIVGFLRITRSGSSYDVHWKIHLKEVEEFVEVKTIEPRVRTIQKSPDFDRLNERQKLAVTTFLDTVDGKIKDRW